MTRKGLQYDGQTATAAAVAQDNSTNGSYRAQSPQASKTNPTSARECYLGSKWYCNSLLPFVRWILDRHQQCGGITEIRILGGGRRGVWSGYFDGKHCDDLVQAILPTARVRSKVPYDDYPRIGEANVYFTLQAVHADLLARSANWIRRAETTTSDADIVAYCLFAIDIDPVRKAGISATDEEKAHAWAVAEKIVAWFAEHGIRSMIADSGNGCHLLIPTTPYTGAAVTVAAGKARVLLKLLDGNFSTAQAKIDTDVFNPGRIFKLYGTLAMKGDPVPDRPHRWASVDMTDVPAEVTREALAGLQWGRVRLNAERLPLPSTDSVGG